METPPATMMALLIAVLFIGVALVFATGLAGKFPGLSDWLDKLFGGLDDTDTKDVEIAKNSVGGLVCAVNSVLVNDRDLCMSQYTSSSTSGSLLEIIGQVTLGPKQGEAVVECEGGGFPEDKECCFFYDQRERRAMPKGTCLAAGGKIDDPDVPIITGTDFRDECTGLYPEEVTCKVKNFRLPERFLGLFDKGKEYISGFGDPTFLIYFQSFPSGEDDAWSSPTSWFHGVSTIMFATMCIGHFVGPFVKAGKWILTKTSPTALAKATVKIAGKTESVSAKLKDLLVKYGKMKPERAEAILHKEALVTGATKKKTLISTIKDYFGKDFKNKINLAVTKKYATFDDYYVATRELGLLGERGSIYYKSAEKAFADVATGKEIVTDLARFLPKEAALSATRAATIKGIGKLSVPVVTKTMGYLAIDAPAAYLLYIIDKKIRRTIDVPDKMILDMPGSKRDEYNLEFEFKEVPILLDKDNDPSFYLASPCHTDLEIRKELIYCKRYVYESSGAVECERASDREICNEYYQGIGILPGWFTGKDCDKILSWVPKCGEDDYRGYDRTMFVDNNNDGVWDEVIIYQYFKEVDINANKIVVKDPNPGDDDNRLSSWKAYDENGDIIEEGTFYPLDPSEDVSFRISGIISTQVEIRDDNDDGLWDKVIVGNPPSHIGTMRSVIADLDGDGDWETMGIINTKGEYEPKIALSSKSEDGNVYYMDWCRTGAVIIKVDEDSMKWYKDEYKEDYNFCYWRGNELLSDALVVGSFAANAFVKKLGVGGFLLGTAADCGLAYISMKTSGGNWPDRSAI